MTPHTNWLPGVLVLVGGLLFGLGWVLFARRKGQLTGGAVDETLANLEKRANDLIDQLRELQQDRHQLSDEQFSAEKSRLEKAAADALRARDGYLGSKAAQAPTSGSAAGSTAAPAPAQGGFFAQHPQLAGALWGGGVVLFFAVLAFTLYSSLKPRSEGQEATGINPNEQMGRRGPMQQPQSDPELESALARANNDPSNVELAAEVSHELIRVQRFQEAEKLTRRALGVDPFHVENRIHLQVIRATEGQEADAQKELQRISDTAPDAYEATLFLGVMAMQRGDKVATLEYFERFASEAPKEEQPPQLLQGIAMLRQQLGRN